MRKIILRQHQCPGDILALTAAVRDLKLARPDYLIMPETTCMDIWQGNPHISWINRGDPEAEVFYVDYDGYCDAGETGGHITEAFRMSLENKLGIPIPRTSMFPDLHVPENSPSILERLTGKKYPYWILNAGYKNDYPLKNWGRRRYQRLVELLAGDVCFVQVGDSNPNHIHPHLDAVVNIVGKTSLRDFIVLCSQAEGSVGPVSMHCHIMAAFRKPCVVVAGGREPYRYVAYPNQRHLHTCGLLKCCAISGCWKKWASQDQAPLRDRVDTIRPNGEIRKWQNRICSNLIEGEPRCMAMITPEMVADEILKHYSGGALYGGGVLSHAAMPSREPSEVPHAA